MSIDRLTTSCPCGTGRGYDGCCGPLHRGERPAATALELMRSRYAAHALGDADYLFRTWHPRTRPADTSPVPGRTWTRLEVVSTSGGGEADEDGVVEFVAHHRSSDGAGAMHEVSRFARRAGRWVYVDGDIG